MTARHQLLGYVKVLGLEFARRDMRQHAQKLRVYYLALKRGLTSPSHELDVKWTEPFVIEWLKTLQLAPFEKAYSFRPRGSSCTRCPCEPGAQPTTFTDSNFPGGSKMRCQKCGSVWLERDR